MYKVSRLPNGFRIVSLRVKNMSSVSLGVWAGAGSRYENEQLSGISHFLEHLLFKGTRKRSFRRIKEAVEGTGGTLNAFTSEEVTCYMAKVMAENSADTVDVLLDMVTGPRLRQEDIEKERRVIFEEIKMYYDLPNHLAYDELMKLLWPDHPLGRNLAGSFTSLENIGRQRIKRYFQKHYTSANMVLAACGAIDHDKLVAQVSDFWGGRDKHGAAPLPVYIPVKDGEPMFRIKLTPKKTKQTHLILGWHAFERAHPLRHAMSLLHIMLGANMSSRLFNEVRENKGLAYEIGTSLKRFNDTGVFMIHAGVVHEKAEEAIRLIFSELNRMKRRPVNRPEFERAVKYYRGQLLMTLEDSLEQMMWMGERLMTRGGVEIPAKIIREVEKVSPEDVRQAAESIFRSKSALLSVVTPIGRQSEKKLYSIIEAS